MPEVETFSYRFTLIVTLVLITGQIVSASTPEGDREVLLQLKSFLMSENKVNQGKYVQWNVASVDHCEWHGISCSAEDRVIAINLSDHKISGNIFRNFSALTELLVLDLSMNTMEGVMPSDLNGCSKLKYLNCSHNLIGGVMNLTGLNSLEILDLTHNRLSGDIRSTFPAICSKLITVNISSNYFNGSLENCFDECAALQYLDLSTNNFTGELWQSFPRLQEFSVSGNNLTGELLPPVFSHGCHLKVVDLSENHFYGEIPVEIANCRDMFSLLLWGNSFTGRIPSELGSLLQLSVLVLGSNKFYNDIPESLLSCSNLSYLDMSNNEFGGDIQEIFGRLVQVKFLLLHGNSYTGGIYSSGILQLQNVRRLDLSYNSFSSELPVEFSKMPGLRFLILAHNQFKGSIPLEYGDLSGLQALDLSYNMLSGQIPPTIGKMKSLLWLMLANNSLTGGIPPEIGNCGSLLWLNLAGNQLSGKIPPQLSNIGLNVTPTFELNRRSNEVEPGAGECLALRRWMPADYPPFSFVYTILTRKNCKIFWDQLLKGHGIFPICVGNSTVRMFKVSGYVQISSNQLTGAIPPEIGMMQNISLIHLGMNDLSGTLPVEIHSLALVVLNITHNRFSGEIPSELGSVKCLQILDLSVNNFSGLFPASLNKLTDLSKFNVSYNPFITGMIPTTGQLATFEHESFLGDPLLINPSFPNSSTDDSQMKTLPGTEGRKLTNMAAFLVVLGLSLCFIVCGLCLFAFCFTAKQQAHAPEFLLEDMKYRHNTASTSCGSSPLESDCIQIIHLDKIAFTYADILKATEHFSEERVIGKGGSGTVYKGILLDGREVAVKKLQREGTEGEREFHAEMEILSSTNIGQANLVTLYGWCLFGSEKILVYEYMEGGSLDELLTDRTRLTWQRRIEVATGVAQALMFLHHECFPAIVHRDVKASNVLLDRKGTAHVTDFGLARVVGAVNSHVSTIVAGTVGYVAPEYGQTWQVTTKGDVYSFGVLAMELATARRAVDGGEECLLDWARRVIGNGRKGLSRMVPVLVHRLGLTEGAEEMCELLKIGLLCTVDAPLARPNMKEVLLMLTKISINDNNRC